MTLFIGLLPLIRAGGSDAGSSVPATVPAEVAKDQPAPADTPRSAAPAETSRTASTGELAQRWGIEDPVLRLTANGYLLDFRFRVVDPDKAAPLFDPRAKPCLVDEATGATFYVPTPPKVGALRTSRTPKAGTTSFILFANPGQYIASGRRVSIQIGDFHLAGLAVVDK